MINTRCFFGLLKLIKTNIYYDKSKKDYDIALEVLLNSSDTDQTSGGKISRTDLRPKNNGLDFVSDPDLPVDHL